VVKVDIRPEQAVLASPVAALKETARRQGVLRMRKSVPTWLAVVVIVAVIVVAAVIFALAGRPKEQKMPEGFKPAPPMFKEAPSGKR